MEPGRSCAPRNYQLLTTILDAVYTDMKDRKAILAVEAKPAFQGVLGVTTPALDNSVILAAR